MYRTTQSVLYCTSINKIRREITISRINAQIKIVEIHDTCMSQSHKLHTRPSSGESFVKPVHLVALRMAVIRIQCNFV